MKDFLRTVICAAIVIAFSLVIMQGLINTHKENIKTILNSKN
jgi:hypothetical protein